jgi:hypothetical protein
VHLHQSRKLLIAGADLDDRGWRFAWPPQRMAIDAIVNARSKSRANQAIQNFQHFRTD